MNTTQCTEHSRAERTSWVRGLRVGRWWLSAIIPLLLGSACNEGFTYSATTDEATVQGSGPVLCPVDWSGTQLDDAFMAAFGQSLSGAFDNLAIQIDAEIARRDIRVVSRIELEHVVFRMTQVPSTPDNQNTFGFVRAIRLFVEPVENDSDLPRRLLGSNEEVAEASTSISLKMEPVNLKPYFEGGFRITAEVQPRTCLRDDIPFRIDFTARVFL